MDLREDLGLLLRISRLAPIARRYVVTNGFDAALAMLGLLMGFRSAATASPELALTAGFGAAVALGISGFSSTYASEAAERRRELDELRGAMLDRLEDSAHVRATASAPILIAIASGFSPFVVAQLTMLPLWLTRARVASDFPVFDASVAIALGIIFGLGVLLGQIGGTGSLRTGLRTLGLGVATAALIVVLAP